jgi:hypothetical protein
VEDLLAHKQAVERGEVFTPRDSAKEGDAQ